MPEELCPICEGSGLQVFEREDGSRGAKLWESGVVRTSERVIKQARIPSGGRTTFTPQQSTAHAALCCLLLLRYS
jgi:hypothetical protein